MAESVVFVLPASIGVLSLSLCQGLAVCVCLSVTASVVLFSGRLFVSCLFLFVTVSLSVSVSVTASVSMFSRLLLVS